MGRLGWRLILSQAEQEEARIRARLARIDKIAALLREASNDQDVENFRRLLLFLLSDLHVSPPEGAIETHFSQGAPPKNITARIWDEWIKQRPGRKTKGQRYREIAKKVYSDEYPALTPEQRQKRDNRVKATVRRLQSKVRNSR